MFWSGREASQHVPDLGERRHGFGQFSCDFDRIWSEVRAWSLPNRGDLGRVWPEPLDRGDIDRSWPELDTIILLRDYRTTRHGLKHGWFAQCFASIVANLFVCRAEFQALYIASMS